MYDLQPYGQPAVPQHGARAAASPGNLSAIISRIEEAVDEETTQIRRDPTFDIKGSNARKSRYLYELTKAIKGLGQHDLAPEHRDGILRLREKLVVNEAAIRAHLDAVGEVAALIRDAMHRAENDGTYSESAFGRSAD
jgi:hypothetical protein